MVRASGLVVVLLSLPALGSAATFRAHLRRPRHGLQVRLSPITVAPGSEREVCQLVTLPNRKAMDASEITMAMPSGATYTSHHFAIFLYQGEHPEGIPERAVRPRGLRRGRRPGGVADPRFRAAPEA